MGNCDNKTRSINLMSIFILKYFLTTCLIILATLSCSEENNIDETEKVAIKISASSIFDSSDTNKLTSLRLVVFNTRGVLIANKRISDDSNLENIISINIHPSKYFFYAIANENPDITNKLNTVKDLNDFKTVKLQASSLKTESNICFIQEQIVLVRADETGINGELLYNGEWVSTLELEVERLAVKVDVSVRSSSSEEIKVRKIELVNTPVYQYLETASDNNLRTIEISSSTQKSISSEYTQLVDGILVAECLTENMEHETLLKFELYRNGIKENISIGCGNMIRNTNYKYNITITQLSFIIDKITISEWANETSDIIFH